MLAFQFVAVIVRRAPIAVCTSPAVALTDKYGGDGHKPVWPIYNLL
jgi:hypothetical protein